MLAWGNNSDGALGDGSAVSVNGPVQVAGQTNASQVSAGWELSLAVYVPPLVAQQ